MFPKPRPTAGAPPKAESFIEAGQKACRGKTPAQVAGKYMPQARAADAVSPEQEELVDQLGSYESNPTSDFAAGQIAAGIYEATLPELQQRSGYQGCVYELALQLRQELANKG